MPFSPLLSFSAFHYVQMTFSHFISARVAPLPIAYFQLRHAIIFFSYAEAPPPLYTH
jgi:hypothetical protein